MRPLLVLVVLLIAHVLAGCSAKTVYRVSQFVAGSCQGADLYSTGVCIGAKRCREGNPALLRVVNETPAFGIVKGGTAVGMMVATHKVYEAGYGWQATAANFAQGGFCGVAAHNWRVSR